MTASSKTASGTTPLTVGYVPEMRADEAVLIKCYDSAEDGTARFTAHSAFEDPTAPADVLPRESIEVRTLVFHNA
jgi:hypothetical protein